MTFPELILLGFIPLYLFRISKRIFYYYKNGQLWIKNNYKNVKLEGERLVYYENGQLEKTEIYKDGKIIKTI